MTIPLIMANGLLGVVAMASAGQAERAIDLAVSQDGNVVEVTLTGNSQTNQRVDYELELSGTSTSLHKGSTQLRANHQTVLSTMRMTAAPDWCVRARITEQNGSSYEYSEGRCD